MTQLLSMRCTVHLIVARCVLGICTQFATQHPVHVLCCAVLCRAGEAATLNPVEPLVPAGYVQGELRLPSQKAAAAVKAAAQAAGLSESVIQGIKVVSHSSIHYA